jgi:hypothetical protein
MKRKRAWVCLLVSLLVLGGLLFLLFPRDPITQANCDRIKSGMTDKDVEELLGTHSDPAAPKTPNTSMLTWKGSRGMIYVEFVNFGKTVGAGAWFVQSEPKNLRERIRDWLGI